jgi:hypothetical protein
MSRYGKYSLRLIVTFFFSLGTKSTGTEASKYHIGLDDGKSSLLSLNRVKMINSLLSFTDI